MFGPRQSHQLPHIVQQSLPVIRMPPAATIQAAATTIRKVDFKPGVGQLPRTALVPAGVTLNAMQSDHHPAHILSRDMPKAKSVAV